MLDFHRACKGFRMILTIAGGVCDMFLMVFVNRQLVVGDRISMRVLYVEEVPIRSLSFGGLRFPLAFRGCGF